MLRIISLLSLLFCITDSLSQSSFTDRLLKLEQQRFEAPNESVKTQLSLEKINWYLSHDSIGASLFQEIKRVDYKSLSESIQRDFLWNATFVSYINKEPYRSNYYLDKYAKISADTSIEFYLLSALINKYDTLKFNQNILQLSQFSDSLKELNCLIKLESYEKKHLLRSQIASAIVPGLGSMMNGYWMKGTSSLLCNSAMIYASYLMFRSNLYLNALTWGLSIWIKFYTGNIRLSKKLFEREEIRQKNKLTNQCELTLENVLKKYPLHYRLLIQ